MGKRSVAAPALSGAEAGELEARRAKVGEYPIVTSQYSSTDLYQVSYHIQ